MNPALFYLYYMKDSVHLDFYKNVIIPCFFVIQLRLVSLGTIKLQFLKYKNNCIAKENLSFFFLCKIFLTALKIPLCLKTFFGVFSLRIYFSVILHN